MLNADDFVKLIKRTAVEAVNASKPANMVFGTVIGTAPLKIKVDQKLILTSAQLSLSRNVTDYELDITMDHSTELTNVGGELHQHTYQGQKKFKVHNGLKNGEEVILMQVSGGQKYIVVDRINKG